MKVREYTLMSECVERGIAYGYAKAHKHTDHPGPEQVLMAVRDQVMLEINEYFVLRDIDDE